MNLQNKMREVNLSNARLLYTNKILNSGLLNERQRNKFAEAISKTKNVEEVKMVYETLQSAMGATKKVEVSPKSLNEVISNPSLSFKSRDYKKETEIDPNIERMRILAGIKNKN
jgi:hypothetical protein